MKKKKALAALTAAVLIAFGGCLDEDDTDYTQSESDAETTFNSDVQKTEDNDADVSDEQSSEKAGSFMSLDDSGRLNITRSSVGSVPMGEDGTWTVFVYICGSDLESEYGCATSDISEMLDASTGSDVRFVIQTGGANEWQNDVVSTSGICRYEISDGEIYTLDEQPDASMADAGTLADFISWGVENCPAAKMGLVLWNHGGGSISGVCFDEANDYDSLTLSELGNALSESSASMTDKFEFIGFDACLMATVETANTLAPYARYMYASEETEPGGGWDYTSIGNYLGENPYADGAELGQTVCDSFYDACVAIDDASGATLSVIDLSKIDDVIMSFNDYAKELYDTSESGAVPADVIRNIKNADNYGGNTKTEGYTNMVDLAGVISSGAGYSESSANALKAIDEAVIYKRNGSDHSDACGLSVFYPLNIEQGSAEFKVFGDVAVSPYYLSFVDRLVYSGNNGGSDEGYDNSAILDGWDGSGSSSGLEEYFDEQDYTSAGGESAFIEFYDEPQLLDDGTYGFSLTDESLEYAAGVQACVYMLSDDMEDIIEMGISGDIIADWETGVFTDNFDGYWFSLPDGQPLAVYIVGEYDGYDIYTSPVIINGEETNLRITHDYENGYVTIDGVWDGIDENGMAARTVYELSEGDSITPIYYSYAINSDDESYYYGSEYIFDGEPEIYFDMLYDGEYLYGFNIDDIYGNYFITDFVNFTVDGGDIYYTEE